MHKKWISALTIFLLCSVFFSACSSEPKVIIRMSSTEYTTDVETIEFEVVNEGWREVRFGNYYEIQKKVDVTWETLETTGDFAIYDISNILGKGKSCKFTSNIQERFSRLEAGEYRIMVELLDDEKTPIYREFTIVAPEESAANKPETGVFLHAQAKALAGSAHEVVYSVDNFTDEAIGLYAKAVIIRNTDGQTNEVKFSYTGEVYTVGAGETLTQSEFFERGLSYGEYQIIVGIKENGADDTMLTGNFSVDIESEQTRADVYLEVTPEKSATGINDTFRVTLVNNSNEEIHCYPSFLVREKIGGEWKIIGNPGDGDVVMIIGAGETFDMGILPIGGYADGEYQVFVSGEERGHKTFAIVGYFTVKKGG